MTTNQWWQKRKRAIIQWFLLILAMFFRWLDAQYNLRESYFNDAPKKLEPFNTMWSKIRLELLDVILWGIYQSHDHKCVSALKTTRSQLAIKPWNKNNYDI